jgi:hypothetical protein
MGLAKRVKGKRLKTLRESGVLDEELGARGRIVDGSVLRLPSGEVLHDYETFGLLYASVDKFMEVLLDTPPPLAVLHVLTNRASGREDFVEHIGEFVGMLPSKLEIPAARLDFSMESLSILDRAIARLGRKTKGDFENIVDAIIAYVGEVVRVQTSGKWTPRFDAECDVWEPFVTSSSGRMHAVHLLVVDELLEQYPRFSVAGAVEGELLPPGEVPHDYDLMSRSKGR